jgi:hypothetical protein
MSGKRPTVTLRCPADSHHGPGERIVEFSFPDGTGGLLSLRSHPMGNVVELYRLDRSLVVPTAGRVEGLRPMSSPTPSLVLVFSKRSNSAQAAKLHSSACPVVARAEGKPMAFSVVRTNLAAEIRDLTERIFPVRRCPCSKGLEVES